MIKLIFAMANQPIFEIWDFKMCAIPQFIIFSLNLHQIATGVTEAQYRLVLGKLFLNRSIISYASETDPAHVRLLIDVLERLFGRSKLETLYWSTKASIEKPEDFFTTALNLANIERTISGSSNLDRTKGPLILVANHPFGLLDGLALCELAHLASSDFKILLHSELCRDHDLNRFFLPVDFSASKKAQRANIHTKNEALATLERGGCIAIFPGGGVATRSAIGFGDLREFPWSTFVAKLVLKSSANVIPVHFEGENSWLFHLVSGFSQSVRLALLMRELKLRMNTQLKIRIGTPLTNASLKAKRSRSDLTEQLEYEVMVLGQRAAQDLFSIQLQGHGVLPNSRDIPALD